MLFWVPVAAQQQPYLFSYLGVDDGLQEESIGAVQQDAHGFIWIASYSCLQRYDGQRFINFFPREDDARSLPPGGIISIVMGNDHRLWILTNKATVGYMDVNSLKYHPVNVTTPPGYLLKKATVLHKDEDGNILLIFVGAGFITYNEQTNTFAEQYNPFRLPRGWEPQYLYQDKQRNYWVGSQAGLLKYSATKKLFSYRGHNAENDPLVAKYEQLTDVVFVRADAQKRYWITAWPKQVRVTQSFEPATGETTEWSGIVSAALKDKYFEIKGITEMKDGSLWVAGGNVLGEINYPAKAVEIMPDNAAGQYSIRYDEIHQLFEDREKNIWICTNKGLFRVNPEAQMFRVITNRLPGRMQAYNQDVTDVIDLPDGTRLVSTWGNGVFAYDSNFNPITTPYVNRNQELGEKMTWCITRRSNGDIWRGAQDGELFIYEAATQKTIKLRPPALNNSTVRQIVEDKNGNMWMGTQRGRLVQFQQNSGKFLLQQSLDAVIARLYIDTKNKLWVCTDHQGVFRINPRVNKIEARYTSNGPNGSRLRQIGASDILQYNDSIYVLASDGLNLLNINTNRFKYFTTDNGLPSPNIFSLECDRAGYIWMSSAKGVLSYHPAKKKLSIYTATDGVPTNSFNVGSSAVLKNGDIAFGTNHDLLVFSPHKITVETYLPPTVTITGFALMNKSLPVDSLRKLRRLKTSFLEHSLTIDLSTLTYQNQHFIYYKMEHMDKDWVKAGSLNQANYNYMPPGKYVFKTACKDVLGNFGTITEMEIYITPPFWKTWWFYCLLAFAAVIVLYWVDKMRVERIRDTERVRTRIATSLTKDMSSTLSNINMLSEMARFKAERDLARTKEYIGQISEKSSRMMEVMDDMIWSINPQNDELQYTIQRMKKYAAQVQTNFGLEVAFNIDAAVTEIQMNMDRRHELLLLFKEAINNAGKHSGGQFAAVRIKLQQKKLSMKIIDNGKGFDPETVRYGRGLTEMRKKAKLLKAELQIHSEVNTGTRIELVMEV